MQPGGKQVRRDRRRQEFLSTCLPVSPKICEEQGNRHSSAQPPEETDPRHVCMAPESLKSRQGQRKYRPALAVGCRGGDARGGIPQSRVCYRGCICLLCFRVSAILQTSSPPVQFSTEWK